ncbi:MAG: response regulator [Deltaproteobacteria bacterium]|nr:response regulator [Deltaproteobacteria bacterium]
MDDLSVMILLIEDDEDDYVIIRDIISGIHTWRCQLDWVSTPENALDMISSGQYQVCLLDYRLGEKNGIELLKVMKQKGFDAPVIMLTGYGDHETDLEAMKAGAADYLEKGNLESTTLERSIRYSMDRANALKAIRESESALRALSGRLVEAQERERTRIAKELHDSIGSNLTAIKYILEDKRYRMGAANIPQDGPTLERIIELVKETMEETQRMSTNLRPSVLDDLGIIAAIQWAVRRLQEVYSTISIETRMDIAEDDVPDNLKIVILRMVQEALNNSLKHSGADKIRLCLQRNNDNLELIVEDNGKGFDPEGIRSKSDDGGGMGLMGMKERAEVYGGNFRINSGMGKGTIIQAVWSLHPGAFIL